MAIWLLELLGMVGLRPKSKLMSSTIIPPKSPPTYQALLRASAGVASTVDDSATTMASFRIIFPFLLRPNRERRWTPYGKRSFRASAVRPLPVAEMPQTIERQSRHPVGAPTMPD